MLEFALAGIASITMLITTVQLSLGLWNYHTLAYAVHEATRFVVSHGRGCITGTNSCGITIGDIANRIIQDSIGVPAGSLNVTLTTDSGAVTNCNPITTCTSNATRWPPTINLDNTSGKKVTITATYTYRHSMLIMWAGSSGQKFSAFTFPATSTQTIVF
jgi:hypothetical protein